MLLLSASAGVVAEFIALAEAAPEELSMIANVLPAPPLPFVPAEQHGQLVILAILAYAGPTEATPSPTAVPASWSTSPPSTTVRRTRPCARPWLSDFAAALQQGDIGAYVGFLVDEGEEWVRQAYPGSTWERLAAVKAGYDPTNLSHRNQNVTPRPPAPAEPA
jgi:hypothetical protein